MKGGFTLIEILVVMIIMVLVVGIVGPQGAKMFSSLEHSVDHMKALHKASQEKGFAFIELKKKQITLLDKNYTATIKGILIPNEK